MDSTKSEAHQRQPLSEAEMTPGSTSSPLPQQSCFSPGVFPVPLQTSASPDSRSQSRSPPLRKPVASETLAADPSGASSSRHERMPSVNSIPSKDGQFGVVSSSGQLVCEFRPSSTADVEGTPNPPQQAPEESITRASFASPGYRPAGASASPPQQEPPSSRPAGPTVSTLELAVDYNSYPEVYVPEPPLPQSQQSHQQNHHQQQPQQQGEQTPSLPPRKSPTLDVESPPAPAYSTPADYQRIGYAGTLDMSTAVATVTPLHMLGDQPDTVDCPFCMRRVETSVKKRASSRTHTWGAILFFSTLFGVVAPYCCDWYVNVEHYCRNCRRKVAQRRYDSTETEPLGTRPEHRQVSYYQPAEKPPKKRFRS